ncbi:MAG: 2-oxo acid dehydrogenase subunit E2 [Tenericutes bacterium]|nr:2-oxo acid dehydrogenase subunit E2 [Mycoplasmatota bacterium]
MKRKFGDRKDGKKVRKLDGMHNIMVDIKPVRGDSDVYINQKVDVSNLVKYIEKKKTEDTENKLTYFHAFSMAFAKLAYNRPLLNRFIANRTFYDRNDVILAFVAKIAFSDSSEEVMINIKVDENDSIFDLRDKILEKVNKTRSSKEGDKKDGTNDIVDIIGRLPKFIRVPIVGFVKFLDKHGWLPNSFTADNIYYSTAILSNLGNLGIGSIYHNVTNFGTSSIIATIGKIHKEVITDEDGKQKLVDVCDFGVNMDERIADGYYFAKSLKVFEHILKNPELLEGKANEKIEIKE